MLDPLMPLICSPWLYLIVFVAVTIDGFFPVMPSEAVVIGLGALSVTGAPHLAALFAVVVAGGIAGDRIAYALGRKAGCRVRNPRLLAAKEKAERALTRYGAAAILVGRFLPYGRTATAMTSGSVLLPMGRFRLFTVLAGVAWAGYVIGLGRLGGAKFADEPLLGAAFGMLLGTVLTGTHTLVVKCRAALERRRAAARPAVAVPAPVDRVLVRTARS